MSALSGTAKAILRHPTGRVSANGITATVFGCTGFLGRYVCAQLGRTGSTIITPYRGDEMEVRHLRVMTDLGGMAHIPFSGRDKDSIREAVEGSDIVINLIGKHYETKHIVPWWINYSYEDVHIDVARNIAEVCAEVGVPRLIHHSSIVAKPNSPSVWAASKYRGEMAVRKAFPNVNIVRSSVMYGPEDRFLNWYANRTSTGGIPLIENGEARVQPVFVNDVAHALYALCVDKSIKGQTFELVGDEEYSIKEIVDLVIDVTKQDPALFNLPLSLAKMIGKAGQQFPDPKFTEDLATLMSLNQVKTSSLPGLRELDIEPSNMEKESFSFLFKYNKGGHFQEVSGYH